MQNKSSIREELLKRRNNIPPEVRKVKSRLIGEKIFSIEEFRNAQVVFCFASFRTEVDTLDLIKKSLSEGKRLVLPKVEKENHSLLLFEIKNTEELSPGYMGIPEPAPPAHSSGTEGEKGFYEGRLFDINNVDVVIIPGAAFDVAGNRLGYGAGYYDKLLSKLTKIVPIIAPAFEEQITDEIPSEPHDIKVHIIVTDRRIIRCV